ncbi:hypothetical protein CEXT_447451 [Caerostris extrusa]|uniref:Ribosomal protein S18 n=1 Tax=Caerostris extrusa TaxID=172846 RepID=A0AAV4VY52_CAEEX|nr:hypothetical protein CEXT_447451 [Caerostris extrusa]
MFFFFSSNPRRSLLRPVRDSSFRKEFCQFFRTFLNRFLCFLRFPDNSHSKVKNIRKRLWDTQQLKKVRGRKRKKKKSSISLVLFFSFDQREAHELFRPFQKRTPFEE